MQAIAETCEPCICTHNVTSRDDIQQLHLQKEKETDQHDKAQTVSCDNVDARRIFYYDSPKPDPSYLNRTGYWVPNIVHFVWYTDTPKPLSFISMLSAMSAHRYIQPDVILFHTNMEPTGEYWERVVNLPSFSSKSRWNAPSASMTTC